MLFVILLLWLKTLVTSSTLVGLIAIVTVMSIESLHPLMLLRNQILRVEVMSRAVLLVGYSSVGKHERSLNSASSAYQIHLSIYPKHQVSQIHWASQVDSNWGFTPFVSENLKCFPLVYHSQPCNLSSRIN